LKFGFFASLTNFFARINQSIPDLVIGKIATMGDVGFFSRGFGAVLFLHKILYSAVAPVVLPHYAEVKRSGGSVVEAYLRSAKLLSVFTLPALAVASAASYPMIIGLFGGQWVAAVPIASILAVWAMLTSVHSFSASAYIVSGHEKWMLNAVLIVSVFRLVLVLFAAPRGIEMVAWAMVVSGAIELLVNTIALKKSIGLQANKLVIALLPSLFITTMCWLATVSIDHIIVFKQTNPLMSLALVAVSLTVIWFSLLRVTKHEAWYLIWDVLGKRKK
jgi:O-antigen/teichoic acid export membrane protein